jgi:AcrR family transcriptional regulator
LFQVRARWSVPSPTCVVRARVPLGTVHYIFPTKEQLLRAVLEDVVEEISNAARASAGTTTDLDSAMHRTALEVWSQLVEAHSEQQLMQYELTMWALRTPGMAAVATWQYELYLDVLTTLWTQAAARAGVTLAIPAEQLAHALSAVGRSRTSATERHQPPPGRGEAAGSSPTRHSEPDCRSSRSSAAAPAWPL